MAAAYTLAPFASLSPGITNIGTSSTNLTGLYNAAAAAGTLANLTTGQAPAANSITGVIVPTAEMNTLANILSSCINTNVGTVPSTTCASLFTAATPPSGTAPTDTFQAAIDIALNPGNNVATLYGLSTPSPPYQPTLTKNPGDFALGIFYNGGIMAQSQGPQGIDIDAQGNVWVSVLGGGRSGVTSGLLEITPGTGVVSPSSGAYLNTMLNPQAVAINGGGMVEVADYDAGVFEYAPTGATGPSFTSIAAPGGAASGAAGLAIDNHDSSTWVTYYHGNALAHISATGTFLTASSPLAAGTAPWGIAVDPSEDVIAADSDTFTTGSSGSNSAKTEYSPTGTGGTYTGGTVSTIPGYFPSDVAIDNAGNSWLTVNTGPLVYSPSGSPISPTAGYATNSDNVADSIEIDGLGRAFVSNNSYSNQTQPGSLTVFSSTGTLLSTTNSNYGYFANNTIPVDPFHPAWIGTGCFGQLLDHWEYAERGRGTGRNCCASRDSRCPSERANQTSGGTAIIPWEFSCGRCINQS